MNSLLESIRNWKSRLILPCILGLLALGNFINRWEYFIGVFCVTTIIALIRYFNDKKWLSDAEKYIRMSEKRPLWKRALGITWTIGITLLIIEFDDVIDIYVHDKTTVSFFVVLLILYAESYFRKFVDSVKSFDEGIQLPGRNQEVIPWREIYTFTFTDDAIFISSSKGEHDFAIHEDDSKHATEMISDWQQRNGRRR